MGERPFPQDATAEMKYAELRAPVQDHVRNLRTQLFELARKYGKRDPNDLRELVEGGEIPMEDVEKITGLMLAMTESFKADRLSGEAGKSVERELEVRETMLPAIDWAWRTLRDFSRVLDATEASALVSVIGRFVDEDPDKADELVDALPLFMRTPAFFEQLAKVWIDAGQLSRAVNCAAELPVAMLPKTARLIGLKAAEMGDSDRAEAMGERIELRHHGSYYLDVMKSLLFKHKNEEYALCFLIPSKLGILMTAAQMQFFRFRREQKQDPTPFLLAARDTILKDSFPGFIPALTLYSVARELAKTGDINGADQIAELVGSRDDRVEKTVVIGEGLAQGGHFAEARAFVTNDPAATDRIKATAFFRIAFAEVESDADPAESIRLGTASMERVALPEKLIAYAEAAFAYAGAKRFDEAEDAIRKIAAFKKFETLEEDVLAEILDVLDRFASEFDDRSHDWSRLYDLMAEIIRHKPEIENVVNSYVDLAESMRAAGVDPAEVVFKAWDAATDQLLDERLASYLDVVRAAHRLQVPTAHYWEEILRLVRSPGVMQSDCVVVLMARVKLGEPIADMLDLLDAETSAIKRGSDSAKVAHAIFEHATKTFDLLPPAEQRRIRRRFGIMEPNKP